MYVPNLREWERTPGVECHLTNPGEPGSGGRGGVDGNRGCGGEPVQEAGSDGSGGEHDCICVRAADHVPVRDQGFAGDGI